MNTLTQLLHNHTDFAKVIDTGKPFKKLNFSASNTFLSQLPLSDTSIFSHYVSSQMLSGSQYTGIGGYNENRIIYRQREHFLQQENPRCIHLGVDIWENAGEPVYTPSDAWVHSFAFNDHFGDYGPTIILAHKVNETVFFTLYGHLSVNSLSDLHEGKTFLAGDQIGEIGNYPKNGDWPPHLHFQVIADMGNWKGDFPGVCSIGDRQHFLAICPDPNLILRINELT